MEDIQFAYLAAILNACLTARLAVILIPCEAAYLSAVFCEPLR
jgi:hypothetical protein